MENRHCVEYIRKIEGLRLITNALAYRAFRAYLASDTNNQAQVLAVLRTCSDSLDRLIPEDRKESCPAGTVLIDGMCVPE